MKIRGYLYALGVSLLLTMFISNFYKVKNPFWQGVTLTLLYIFMVHFGQGDHCLVYGLMDSSSSLFKTLTFQDKCPGGSCNLESNNEESGDDNNESGESGNITNQFTPEIITNPNLITNEGVLSSDSLNSKVHANNLMEENELNENRLETTNKNNLYYAHTNESYPMLNRGQINQQDCTNDGSCLIPEDHLNLHPIRQSMKELLPIPNIGLQELTTMNQLNHKLNANLKYPVPVESHHSCATTDIRDYYKSTKPSAKSMNDCQKCSSGNDNKNNESGNGNGNGNNVKETFGLFETYHMEDLKDPIYINAPQLSDNVCFHCVTGGCYGDLCSINPHKKFERNDPLGL